MIMERNCWRCKHYHRQAREITCDAFTHAVFHPKRPLPCAIPDEILDNKVFHDKPYPGDHGIQFEPIEEE